MQVINFNGQIMSSEEPVIMSSNRAFKYGDGIFESIIKINNEIPLLKDHLSRLKSGMSDLYFLPQFEMNEEFLSAQIDKVSDTRNARIRFSVFRKSGGYYKPEENGIDYLIESEPLDDSLTGYPIDVSLNAGISNQWRLSHNPISHLKSLSAMLYVMASIEAGKRNVDDLILLTEDGYIAEATSSNIFVVTKSLVLTPTLECGCVNGVLRHFLLANQAVLGLEIREAKIPLKSLDFSNEIWVTNATRGIRWVKNLDDHQFENSLQQKTIKKLNALLFN